MGHQPDGPNRSAAPSDEGTVGTPRARRAPWAETRPLGVTAPSLPSDARSRIGPSTGHPTAQNLVVVLSIVSASWEPAPIVCTRRIRYFE
jgi:hypothetical protein